MILVVLTDTYKNEINKDPEIISKQYCVQHREM